MNKKYFKKILSFWVILEFFISFCNIANVYAFSNIIVTELVDERKKTQQNIINNVILFTEIFFVIFLIFLIIIEASNFVKVNMKKHDNGNKEWMEKLKTKYGKRLAFTIAMLCFLSLNIIFLRYFVRDNIFMLVLALNYIAIIVMSLIFIKQNKIDKKYEKLVLNPNKEENNK